MLKTVQFVG